MSFIGIDLGASFLKGAWLHPERGTVSDVHRVPFPGFMNGLPPGHREVSPEEILTAVRDLLGQLLAARDQICEGLFFCGQMHGIVLVRDDGSAAGNFISWQDTRCLETAADGTTTWLEEARLRLGAGLIAELGNEYRAGLPVATLYTMSQTGRLTAGAIPLALADFVSRQLTGSPPSTDRTNASAHGLMHVAEERWHTGALSSLGLQSLPLPEILPAATVTGHATISGQRIPVYATIGDQQAALLGTGLVEGELSLNIATGSQASVLARTPAGGDWQLRPYFGDRWLRTITHIPAGRALNRLVALCGELAADQGTPLADPWTQISRLTGSTPSTRLQADLAFFPSAYGSAGSLTGIQEDELSVGHLFRAVFKSMARSYERSATRLVSKNEIQKIVFSGGLVQKLPALQNEIVALIPRDCRFAPHQEDTLHGMLTVAATLPR
jgi:sugar (pentulose or hexulose) kinase